MLTTEEARNNIGALVLYLGFPEDTPEFGLVERVGENCIFVRFHHGDTAAGCAPENLTLHVPARKPSDEAEVERRVKEHNLKPVLSAEVYNDLTDYLLNAREGDRRALLLAGEIVNQIGASRQRAAARAADSQPTSH